MSWKIIEHEGVRYRVPTAKTSKGVWVGWPGGATFIEPKRSFSDADHVDDGIRAPMTGKVVEVKVAVGDVVEADQVVVVLEAMKMEYRLTSSSAGTVSAVQCEAGKLVELGDLLVTVDE